MKSPVKGVAPKSKVPSPSHAAKPSVVRAAKEKKDIGKSSGWDAASKTTSRPGMK